VTRFWPSLKQVILAPTFDYTDVVRAWNGRRSNRRLSPFAPFKRYGRRTLGSRAALVAKPGLLNVLLLAPVWLQILHLLVTDTIWISLVLASATLILETADSRLGAC
jgi:hypothetical protein